MSTVYMAKGDSQGNPISIRYITRLEAETLQSTSEFVPGLNYTIIDADVNLYGGTEITLTAITPSELSLQGSGLFYCPKYDVSAESTGYGIWTTYMEGTFYNIVGKFTANEVVTANNGATATYLAEGFLNWINGDWSDATSISGAIATADVSGFESPIYSIGQIVHWGGKSWTNVNGNIGESIDKYTLDAEWTEIPFNATDYNVYIDEIQYDFGNDMIIYRKDRYNNVVSGNNQVFVEFESPDGWYGFGNPIKDFQWGCAQDDFNTDDYLYIGIQGNQVIDSYFETLNSLAKYIWFNELSQFSFFNSNTLSSGSYFQNNTLSGNSYIHNNTLSNSSIYNNTLSGNSYIQNNTLSNSYIQTNNLSNNGQISNNNLSNNGQISNNTLSNSSSIYNNTLSSNSSINSNTLSSGSSISDNTLSSSYIQNNTLSSNSYIQYNTLSSGSSISDNTLSSSYIQNNTLSSSYIQYNTLSSSYIQYNTLSNGSSINNNTLSSSQLIFSNEIINKTVSNLEMKNINVSIPNTATIIFNQSLSKTIFKRLDGKARLQYVDNSDVIVITNVDA